MDDETKADAPLTPADERALREVWPRTAEALRSMARRANTARGASWEHGARCATHLLNAVGAVGHLLATVDTARLERDEARRVAAMYARSFGRLQSALRLSSEVPLEESVSRILALVGSEKMEPAQPSTPCAECALRDINGECSAQCVAAPAARSER